MRWDASGYGAHTREGDGRRAPDWYFAEGAQGFFSTYLLLANPQPTANTRRSLLARERAGAASRLSAGARSRITIDAGADADLRNRSFGARVTFDQPGVAERAMYFGSDPAVERRPRIGGRPRRRPTWFLAEGATGTFFTTFVLLANPNDEPAEVTLTLSAGEGMPVTRTATIAARQRLTRNIALEDASLANAAVATHVDCDAPSSSSARSTGRSRAEWNEAHNSFGVTAPRHALGPRRRPRRRRRRRADLHPARESGQRAGDGHDHVPARGRHAVVKTVHRAADEPLQRRRAGRQRGAGTGGRELRRAHRFDAADRRRALDLQQRQRRDLGRRHECHRHAPALSGLASGDDHSGVISRTS